MSSSGAVVNMKRLIPFDLFLINFRYNRAYASGTTIGGPGEEKLKSNFEISKLIEEFLTSVESAEVLARQERLILNSQNIQLFLEQLCPHKRHIKLENLKSINLNNNRIKRFNFMFDLSMTKSCETSIPRSKSTPKIDSGGDSDESSSESELSETESIDEEQSMNEPVVMATSSPKEPKSRLKNKLAQLSPLKKRSNDETSSPLTQTPPPPSQRKKSTSSTKSPPEDRALQQAKLMFPNLTHIDLSFNRLKRLSSHLAYLENLSYLNASSNTSLVRVSPKIGLLNKLWNFDLRNCTSLREPVMLDALVRQKTKTSDILGYLKSILEHSRPYTRMKLMFVGVQAIGKTSLLNRLRDEGQATGSGKNSWSERTSQNQITSQANMSTVGIDINEWVYEKPRPKSQQLNSSGNTSGGNLSSMGSSKGGDGAAGSSPNPYLYIYQQLENSSNSSSNNSLNKHFGPITFRTWDFAGQREYYTTHQYFISRRAIYLGNIE